MPEMAKQMKLVGEVRAAADSGTLGALHDFVTQAKPMLQELKSAQADIASLQASTAEVKQFLEIAKAFNQLKASGEISELNAFAAKANPVLNELRAAKPELKAALSDIASVRSSAAEMTQFMALVQQFNQIKASGIMDELRSLSANIQPMLAQLQASKTDMAAAQSAAPGLKLQLQVLEQLLELKRNGSLDEAQKVAIQFAPYIEQLERNRPLINAGLAVSRRHRELKSPVPIRAGAHAGERLTFQIYEEVFMEFCWIPASIEMDEKWYNAPGVLAHTDVQKRLAARFKTAVPSGFWLSRYPCTQLQWEGVLKTNPSYFKGEFRPVESVSWNAAQEFCMNLPVPHGWRYDLPHAEQWIFAALAGASDLQRGVRFYQSGGYTQDYIRCEQRETTEVGRFEDTQNNWGVADILGNVRLLVKEPGKAMGPSYREHYDLQQSHNQNPAKGNDEVGFRLALFQDKP